MKRTDINYIVQATGGKLYATAAGGEYNTVSSVAIDNRKIKDDCLFFCIVGERVDAHIFLPDVREKGCHNVVVTDPAWAQKMADCGDMNVILVEDIIVALDSLTEKYLEDWKDLKKIAITGSAGKTTTKEFAYSVLSRKFKTAKNVGNLNSETGIPLAVFDYPDDSEMAIVEVGIGSGPDMRVLANMVKPDNAIVTNVGSVHMEFFESSREKLLEAKLRIANDFGPENTLIVNNTMDNLSVESVRAHTERDGFRIVTVGDREDSDYRIVNIQDRGIDGVRGTLIKGGCEYTLDIPIVGAHNLFNAATAIAMGELYGISIEDCLEAVKDIERVSSRLDVRRGTYTILNDSYNANPEAMRAAISVICNSEAPRRGLIVGSMGELGAEGPDLHRGVGKFIVDIGGIDYVITLGDLGKLIGDEICSLTDAIEVHRYMTIEEIEADIYDIIKPGDLFLVKGSNALGITRVVDFIEGGQKAN